MKILAIDTALGKASVCIAEDYDNILSESSISEYSMQAEKLFDLIDECLSSAKADYDDIDIFTACIGPGSFTGVRIGVSAAKGLAFAKQKPFIGITSLEALKENSAQNIVTCAIDAGRNQVYLQNFPNGEPLAVEYENIKDTATNKIFCNCYNEIKPFLTGDSFIKKESASYSAKDVANACFKLHNDVSIDRNNPIYLRQPDAKKSSIKRKVIFQT